MTDNLIPLLASGGGSLQKIGQGFCGTVWAENQDADAQASALVLKREDGGPGRSLTHEYRMHNHILSALRTRTPPPCKAVMEESDTFRVNVPLSLAFLQTESDEWIKILPLLPPTFTACNAFISERIMPMSHPIRRRLARAYWKGDKSLVDSIADDKANEHCLVRPYLGRRRLGQAGEQAPQPRTRPSRLKVFSLRNFPLHMDQIEELDLPGRLYATAMADALAFLHWIARVDANDVEFVLARPRPRPVVNPSDGNVSPIPTPGPPGIGTLDFNSEALGTHAMWLLDFDCCRELTMDEDGIRRAASCFWRNDPFYPRPGSRLPEDDELWQLFKSRFLSTSNSILQEEEDTVRRLPEMLMQKIEEAPGT